MRTLISLLFIFIFTGAAVAQDHPDFDARLCGEIFETPAGYNGEQYTSRDWVNGDILLEHGALVRDKKLRYNGFLDQLIWYDLDQSRMVKLEKAFIREFSLELPGGRQALYRKIKVNPADSLEVFAEVLTEGAASLFVQRRIIIRGSSTREVGDRLYLYDDLEPYARYILLLPDRTSLSFHLIRKSLVLAMLPAAYKEQAKAYLEAHPMRLRNERQLAELVKNLN